ncbi:MAG: hypothetical protein KKA84_16470, partial [Bacteroidetes bacterium]|nr:hypothetical protein [Bacteroidota bacterium]
SVLYSQNRGNDLLFQGVTRESNNGVKAQAMAGAFTAYSGDLSSIFYNPAGLAAINKIQISFSGNSYKRTWQETQEYRPNRQYTTLSFILDGLYRPNPDFNGFWDNEAFFNDTSYVVNEPELGTDVYGDGADWKEEKTATTLNNIAIAYPFELFETKFAVAAAYSRKYDILDYDRNDTYLDPHIGANGYGGIPVKVASEADALDVNWYEYSRSRTGEMNSYSAAISADVADFLNLGLTMNIADGNSTDYLHLNKVGVFTLAGQNQYSFTYDSLDNVDNGSSTFKSTSFDVGALIKFERFSLGVNLTLPYTVEKEWSSTSTIASGKDEMDIPLSYTLGLKFTPVDNFTLTADVGKVSYGEADYQLSSVDSLLHNLVNQTSLRFGVEYKPIEDLSLMCGYKNITSVFIPDGAADKNSGPAFEGFSFGASYKIYMVELIAAYEYNSMKYFDAYFSNTNYNKETFTNIYFGATISL